MFPKTLCATAVSLLFISAAQAQPVDFEQSGFSGDTTFFLGFGSETSNFNTDNDIKTGELNSKGKSESEAQFGLRGEVRYTFADAHQFFTSVREDDYGPGEATLGLGYRMALAEDSYIGVSYLNSIGGESFEDPYLVNTKRTTTDVSGSTILLEYDGILGSDFSAELALTSLDVDKEASGSAGTPAQQKLVQRDGSGVDLTVSYDMMLGHNAMLMPAVSYQSFSADGDAMSYTGFGLEMAYLRMMGDHKLMLSAAVDSNSYDKSHPAFAKKRKDTGYELMAMYEYDGFEGWENWSVKAVAGYEAQASNINFYDQNEYIFAVGVGYQF
ncbi:DUF2860 family protein [uncultured Ferrimonas sp.]|uniref:DUF2860 family protein n=1 Tax=uncultured Ferrimonas sp. TaxID=432640 RepID=UPI00261F1CA8|nr:DUF2860 family protein [uncultured Ferrimonas sp.]